MPLKPIEQFTFGGVSSRDNAINYPSDRCLLRRNFLIERDGSLRLRDGFTPMAMQYAPASIGFVWQELTVDNGTFESGSLPVPGWTAADANLSYETAAPFSGAASLVVAANVQYDGARSERRYSAVAGLKYRVSGAVNNNGVANAASIQFAFYDANGNWVGGVGAGSSAADSAWHAVSAENVAPAGAVSALLSLECETAGGGTVKFDDIHLYQAGFPAIHSQVGLKVLTGHRCVVFAQDTSGADLPITTISAVQIADNLLTLTTALLTLDQITYLTNRQVRLQGLSDADFLNGEFVTITHAGVLGGVGLLTASYAHDDYDQAAADTLPVPEPANWSTAETVTLPDADYYVRIVKYHNGTAQATSAEAGPVRCHAFLALVINNYTAYPGGSGIVYRVFFGTTSGSLDQYQDFSNPSIGMGIFSPGSAGSIPRIPAAVPDTGNVEAILGIGVLDLSLGTVIQPEILGKPLFGNGRWSWALANNRLHGTNGVDQKFLMKDVDGKWRLRDIGVRAPTTEEAAAVVVAAGAASAGTVPKSTVGGAQPGYQFYMAFWNRTTGAVSNRVKIGSRILFTDEDHEIDFSSLPNVSAENSELDILIGRTGDGAEVPHAIVDADENWVYVPNGQTSATVDTPGIDGAAELPTTNAQPSLWVKAFARCGDYLHAIVSGGPWCYRSEIGVDDPIDSGHVGRPEQNWGFNPETFPTGDIPIAVHGFNGDAWYQTQEDLAIMVDQEGVPGWQGPWQGAGIAGQDAFAVGFKGYPYWLSGHKQLFTMTSEGPIPISDEYEAALLAKIGDAYLSQVQLVPFRDAELQIELMCIKARDKDGKPFIVIHDFQARDERSPYGQALEISYGNALGNDFYLANLRDKDGHARLWAGASDGQIYQLFDGVTDNGDEFSADLIGLLYIGPHRTAVKNIEWYGDEKLQFYLSDKLDTTLTDERWVGLHESEPEKAPGDENNPHYQVTIPDPEMVHAYVWISLDSHSADASAQGMKLNDPPHVPLETYGRIYMVSPLVGTSRGK